MNWTVRAAALTSIVLARRAAARNEGRAGAARAVEHPRFAPGWVLLGDVATKTDRDRARAAYEAALKAEGSIDRPAVEKKLAALPGS